MGDNFYTARGYQILAQSNNELSASLEDYMEMIYRSIKDYGHTRVNEIANHLHVKPSSVSKMLSKLVALKYISYEKYGVITLTKDGEELGKYLLWRHNTITRFFEMLLGEGNSQAFLEAELAEHILSFETVTKLEWLNSNISENLKSGLKK